MTTISQQRVAENAQGLVVRRREQWGARFDYTTSRPVETPATRLFLHITVTNPGAHSENDAHARHVENIGISRFSATGISYNMLVMPDASIYEAQPLGRRGAHTVNDFKRSSCTTSSCPNTDYPLTAPSWNLNVNARSVALAQNVADEVTKEQIDSAARVAAAWKRAEFVTKNARWHGHRCVSAKECPGNRAWAWMSELERLTEHYTVNGLGEDEDMSYRDWSQADKKALAEDVAKAVWNRINPTLDLSYGTISRYVLNGTRPDRAQDGGVVGIAKQIADLPDQTAHAVWNRTNPSNDQLYGTMVRLLFAWLSGSDQVDNPSNDQKSSMRHALGRIWHHVFNNIHQNTLATRVMVEGMQPLIQAAAEGRELSADEVASIAAALSDAVPHDLAEQVVNEIDERTVSRILQQNNEGTAS